MNFGCTKCLECPKCYNHVNFVNVEIKGQKYFVLECSYCMWNSKSMGIFGQLFEDIFYPAKDCFRNQVKERGEFLTDQASYLCQPNEDQRKQADLETKNKRKVMLNTNHTGIKAQTEVGPGKLEPFKFELLKEVFDANLAQCLELKTYDKIGKGVKLTGDGLQFKSESKIALAEPTEADGKTP